MLINGKEFIVQMDDKTYHCALDITMDFIGGKWKSVVLWYLIGGRKRFGELKKLMPDTTEKMLSIQLKKLEKAGLVQRDVFPEVPLRVEYSLTSFGESLIPVLEAIALWGRKLGRSKGKLVEISTTQAIPG